MNLIIEVKKAGYTWSIQPGDEKDYLGGVRMQMTSPEGVVVETKCFPNQIQGGRDAISVMLVNCLRRYGANGGQKPDVLVKWFDSHGNYPARFQLGVTAVDAYTAMHVALRKLMDGKESVVLWNGFHALDRETGNLFAKFLEDKIAEATPNGAVGNLHMFALELRNDIVEFFNDRGAYVRRMGESSTADPIMLSTLMYSMALAFEKLSGDDCVFGLLGYIFESIPDETGSGVE